MSCVVCVLLFVGLTSAQDVWSNVGGVNGPGNTTDGVPINYDYAYDCPSAPSNCYPVPGSVKWGWTSTIYNSNVEATGWTTSSGVGCNNAYTVGTSNVNPTLAVLPGTDRAVFKGFMCVNDPNCGSTPTLGTTSSNGQCSMGRFVKITQIAQGWASVGRLFQVTVGAGTWSPNITAGGTYTCPSGQFMTNMRCWRTAASGGGCAARQIECATFSTPMFRLDTLLLSGNPFSNTGTVIPSASQGAYYRSALAFVGITTSSTPDIKFSLNRIQIKSCSSGYDLNGAFLCTGKPCPALAAPINGTVVFSPPSPTPIYPSSATFACNTGFTTSQTQNTQCQPNSANVMMWTNPTITCTGVPCAPLSNPSNGQVSTTNNNVFPSTATYSCFAGFVVDFPTSNCQTTGFWDRSPSVCSGIPCKNDSTFYTANAGSIYPTFTNGQKYPSTATYTCQAGYSFTASSQRTCQTTGLWSPSQPICTGVTCPQQSGIANGVVNQSSLVYPANASYSCNLGFQLVGGSALRPCGTDGVFVGTVPSCNPLPCVAPSAATLSGLNVNSTASTATNGFSYPSTITYVCLNGFYPSGSLTQQCTTAGNYPAPAACIARSLNANSLLINNIATTILPATNAVAALSFTGSFGPSAPTSVTFGPTSNPFAYPCTGITLSGGNTVKCSASAGVGSNLTIAVTLSNPSGAVIYGTNFMSFATPVIRNNTLRAAGDTDVGVVSSSSSGGDILNFLCDHCGTVPSQLTVAFGAPLPYGVNCGSITAVTVSGDTQNITCQLGAGAGGPYQFYLTVAGLTKISYDTYKYADGPVIFNVSGCPVNQNSGTSNCPCSGKNGSSPVILTITGALLTFGSPVTVRIASLVYPIITNSSSQVTVALPPGVGTSVSIQIISGSAQSQVVFALGYAAPLITNVSGCVNAAQCNRAGNDVVTINGANFGTGVPAPLVVLIGTFPCNNVIHDSFNPDAQVTCTMTPGKGLSLGIFAIQPNGLLGSSVTVNGASSPTGVVGFGYAECAPGTFDNRTGLNCIPCTNGTYSAVSSQSACSQCAAGTYGPSTGMSGCLEAGQGYYVNSSGSVTRYPCDPGYFTAATQSITCAPCSPGEFAASSAALSCLSCPAGRATGAIASTICANCTPGTYSVQQGQTGCENCLSGWAAPLPGAISCTQCSLGTYSDRGLTCSNCDEGSFQNQEGSTTCVQCDPGKYSNSTLATSCAVCEQGKFQTLFGQSTCSDCPVGSSSFQFGVTACSLCIQGTQQNLTGQFTCNDCSVGRQALLPGAIDCDDCVSGKFASAPRTVVCLDCLVSTATNLTGQSGCPQCAQGRYADSLGQTACSACAIGTYASELGTFVCSSCPPGATANSTGATICAACNPGTFAKLPGLTACDFCGVGFYSGSPGATSCLECVAGTYGNLSGLSTCTSCPPGSFSNLPQSKECGLCLPGKFAIGNAESCTACASRTISLNSGSAACSACPNNAVSNTELTDCVCGPGFLRVSQFQNGVSNLECQTCYVGANCSAAGTTSENVQTLPGWWRSSPATTKYYRCLVAAFCEGGVNSSCLANRAGPLCVSCAAGYRSSRATSACEICPKTAGESWTYSVLIMIAVGVAAVAVYYAVLKLGENQVKQMKAAQDTNKLNILHSFRNSSMRTSRTQTSIVGSLDDSSGGPDSTGEAAGIYTDEYDSPKKKKNGEDPFSLASRRAPNFLFKIKIVIGFFQIANVISFQGDIAWPQLYQSFITIFQVLNLDFVPWQSIGCATGFDYYWKAIITGLIPVAVFILLMIGFVMPSMLLERLEKYSDADTKRLRVKRMRAQLMKLILFTVFLLYPHVSSTVLGVFNCTEVEGVYYLLNDFTLTCFDHRWTSFALPCIVFIIAYPIGIPLAYFFILRKNKGKFQEMDTIVAYGFLYEAYQDGAWYFELLDMIHKLILTSIVPFLPNNMEMASNMIIIILYMQVILVLQPYVRKGDDRLHQIVQAELCLLAMLGWTLGNLQETTLDSKLDFLISVLLIILTVFLLLAFAVMTARNSFKLIQLFRRLRRKKNQQFQAERGGVLELCASDLKKKNNSGVWQDRYFVLCEDGFLEWYSSKAKDKIVGIIPVSQLLAVRDDPNPLRFSWDLKSEITVSFDLQAKDVETCAKWVRCLHLLVAGNKVERMDPALVGEYWRDTTAMRMLRLQRNTSNRFSKVSSGDETTSTES